MRNNIEIDKDGSEELEKIKFRIPEWIRIIKEAMKKENNP